MKKNVKLYQGYHTHPSQDSTATRLDDGTILVTHRTDKREGYIITQLGRASQTTADLTERLNIAFPNGGYNANHVFHSCKRLQKDGIVRLVGHTWILTANGRAKWERIAKKIRTFKGAK